MEAPEFMFQYRSLIVLLALPWSHISTCRSIIALSISIDRSIATCFPIYYFKNRKKIPNWPVLLIGSLLGLAEEYMLFGFCSYNMEIPKTCLVFGCATNQCFFHYWLIQRSVRLYKNSRGEFKFFR